MTNPEKHSKHAKTSWLVSHFCLTLYQNAPLSLCVDASNDSVGAVIHQFVDGIQQPLAFYSKRLTECQKAYSTYDKELLAAYQSVKYFRHMLQARSFILFTDHKPLTYAFQQKPEKTSPRQTRQLDFISQFTTDIRHTAGAENVVADTMSRIEGISKTINFEKLAESQKKDEELENIVTTRNSSLQMKLCPIPNSNYQLYCDVSTERIRPYVTPSFRKAVFDSLHGLAHPGPKPTVRLITERYVWPSIKRDCTQMSKQCILVSSSR